MMKRTDKIGIALRSAACSRLAVHLLAIVLLAGGLAGCDKDAAQPEPGSASGREIHIGTTVQTRAAAVDATPLTGVQFLRKDMIGATAPGDYTGVTPIAGDRAADGGITFADPVPTYGPDDKNAFFKAYWPAGTPAVDKVVWTVDGVTDILVSDEYNAGKYTARLTGSGGASGDPMLFKHMLAQLEVVCIAEAGAAEADVQTSWGKITGIEIVGSNSEVTLDYASPAAVSYATPADLSLVQADYATAFPAAGVTLLQTPSPAVTAAGMFAPDVTAGSAAPVTLKVRTEKVPAGATVAVKLGDGTSDKPFEVGKKHVVTLTFIANAKEIEASAAITDWAAAPDVEVDVKPDAYVSLYYGDAAENGSVTTDLSGSTWDSYNAYVIGSNGSHYTTLADAYAGEKPYAQLQIALRDEESGWSGSVRTWDIAMNICKNKTTDGGGWRLPRLSEMRLIFNNLSAVNAALAAGGGTSIPNTYCWSATELSDAKAWRVDMRTLTRWSPGNKTTDSYIRCVRECPATVNDYYYSDGSYSTTLISGKTPVGVIFWVNPDNGANFKVVSLDHATFQRWSTEKVTTGATGTTNGAENMAVIKAIPDWHDKYSAFAWCDDKTEGGNGWYFPARDELQYLYCASVLAAPVTWSNGTTGAPAFVQSNRDSWNALFTAAGVGGMDFKPNYWSATEDSSNNASYIYFTDGAVNSLSKTGYSSVRCVREI